MLCSSREAHWDTGPVNLPSACPPPSLEGGRCWGRLPGPLPADSAGTEARPDQARLDADVAVRAGQAWSSFARRLPWGRTAGLRTAIAAVLDTSKDGGGTLAPPRSSSPAA